MHPPPAAGYPFRRSVPVTLSSFTCTEECPPQNIQNNFVIHCKI